MKFTQKHINQILIFLTVLAAVKMLFEPFSHDEEYQFLLSYRQIMGDSLVQTMWEPHQTSAFLCTLFLAPYYFITGTFTGSVIYLRIIGTLIHLVVTLYLYKILHYFLNKPTSFYLALFFFNTIPKLIMLPEFGIMQVWFGTLCFLLLIDSMEDITLPHCFTSSVRSYTKLITAALCLCLNVLSYPSCICLYFPFILMIWYRAKRQARFKKVIVFTSTCFITGILYTLHLLLPLGLSDFIRNVSSILTSDVTHTFDGISKLTLLVQHLLQYVIIFFILTVLSFGCLHIPAIKKYAPKHQGIALIGMLLILSNIYQLFSWVILNTGYEYLQIHLAVTLCLGLWLKFLIHPMKNNFTSYMFFGALIGISSLFCVMMLTDLTLLSSVPHALLGSICMLALFAYTASEYPRFIQALLLLFCFTACIGKGYTLRSSNAYNNILQSENICKYGPAVGTVSDYMGAYIYNNEYLLWQDAIPDNSKVLVVTSNLQSTNTIQYTSKNAEVCHYSVVNPTAYDTRLLTYWSYYPEKMPDIIVIDCWFGNMLFEEDSWIVQYIENDFHYTEMIQGDYVRIYKK